MSLPESIHFDFNETDISSKTKAILTDYDQWYHDFIHHSFSSKDVFFQFYEQTNHWDLELDLMDFMQYVHPNNNVREASVESAKAVAEFGNKWSYNVDVYQKTLSVYEQFKSQFDEEETLYITKILKSYKHKGIHLEEETRNQLETIQQELSELQINYSNHLNEVNDALWFTQDELDGVDQDFLSNVEKNEEGAYKIVTQYDHVHQILSYCHVESTRKQLSILFMNRGKEPFQNHTLLQQAVLLRQRQASLLNYHHYADYVLSYDRMAQSTEQVDDFLISLLEKTKEKAQDDVQILKQYFGKDQIESWNQAYYKNIYKKDVLSYDEKMIQTYFPLETLLPNLLGTFEEIFSLQVKEVSLEAHQTWEPSVKCYGVYDNQEGEKENYLIGHFYLDLYPREGKYGHAAAFTNKLAYREDGIRSTPVSSMVCNFTRASKERPALLTFNEVETFFHELGHIFHQLLSKNRFSMFSGTNVECDFVECPSQALENWCYEADFLKRISCHYETGETLPLEMIEKIKQNKDLFIGLHYIRQLQFALYDLKLHKFNGIEEMDVEMVYDTIQNELSPLVHCDGCMAANFGHLMGGYQSGYYGYIWSEVYAAEVFQLFKESGDLFNKEIGLHYRQCILERGGTQTGFKMMENLLGRVPNSKMFLKKFD